MYKNYYNMKNIILVCVVCTVYINFSIADPLPKGCPNIISRQQWNARDPSVIDYTPFPIDMAIIHHTAGVSCHNKKQCKEIIRNIQNYHLDNVDYGDIGYNFLVGGDGNVYEGRGWHKQGAHLIGFNSKSVGIAFIGTFTNDSPTPAQMQAAKDLLTCGVKLGELSKNYKLHGAKQLAAIESPGTKLLQKMKTWPHFAEPED